MNAPGRLYFSVPLKPDGYADDGTPLFVKNVLNPLVIRTLYSPSPIGRYCREFAVLSRCRHDHIIAVKGYHDADVDTEIQLKLELAPYGSVQMFGTSGPEKKSVPPNRLEHLIQIVDALDYLHNTVRVVHGSVDLSHFLVSDARVTPNTPVAW